MAVDLYPLAYFSPGDVVRLPARWGRRACVIGVNDGGRRWVHPRPYGVGMQLHKSTLVEPIEVRARSTAVNGTW